METITSGSVGDLAGICVGMGQISNGTYKLPDGSDKEGLVVTLAPLESDENLTVGAGSEINIGDVLWRVDQIIKVGEGSITLTPLRAVKPASGMTVRKEALDMTHKRDCVRCGHDAGWSGQVEKDGRDYNMIYFCTQCQLDYPVMMGALQKDLKKGKIEFNPGE